MCFHCRVYPWLKPVCYISLSVFLLGFLLWNIDNLACDSLRSTRQRLPPVVGAVTQFHAWWHILTGLGSYLHILFSLQIRSTFLKHRPKVKFLCGVWPMLHIEAQKTSWVTGDHEGWWLPFNRHQHRDLTCQSANPPLLSMGYMHPTTRGQAGYTPTYHSRDPLVLHCDDLPSTV